MVSVPSKLSPEELKKHISEWLKNECHVMEVEGRYKHFHNTCQTMVNWTILFCSIHNTEWGSICAGSGKVKQVPFPFCPRCEPEVGQGTLSTCVHLPLSEQ